MRTHLRNAVLLSSVVTMSALCVSGLGQAPKADPKVQALIDLVNASYKSIPSYQAKVTFKYLPDNPKYFRAGQPLSMEIKLQRPNKLNVVYSLRAAEGDAVKTVRHQIVSDGANVYRWQGSTNTYTKSKASTSFTDVPPTLNLPELEVLLRGNDPFKGLPVPANLLTLGKSEKIGDVEVDVIEGRIAEPRLTYVGKLRILISQKDHTFRGVQFDGEGKDPLNGKPLNFRVEAVYDQVKVSPALVAADFAFSPPAGSREEQPVVRPGGNTGGGN